MGKWYDDFSKSFINIFGEPSEIIPIPEKNKLVLKYPEPFGEKNVYASEAIKSGYFKSSLSDNIKEENNTIYAERILDDFPEIHENIETIKKCNSGLPTKEFEFRKLPVELQEKIVEGLKDRLLSPREIARKQLEEKCASSRIESIGVKSMH